MPARVLPFPDRFNAAEFFVDRAVTEHGWGQRTAFRYQGRSITYQETAEMVARAAGALLASGVRAEQRVLLALPDSPDFVTAFFGAIKAGVVPVPVNTFLDGRDLRYYLDDSGAAALIVHRDLVDRVKSALPSLTIVAGEGGDWELRLATASPLTGAASTHPDDMAFWQYTSGSTGAPKGAVHLHRDMVYAADVYAIPTQRLTPEDRIFSASKMFFAYGLGNSLFCPLRAGASALLAPERPTPEMCLRTIESERPTIFYAVPTLYAAILNHPGNYDTSSLRLAVSAGEALPAEIFRRFQDRFGVEIIDGIGSTEMAHVFISNRPGECRPGSSGRLVDGYDARIVDEAGCDVADGEIGNLLISGGSAAAFYWRKAAQTRSTMLGEWLRTGDKYRRDADGYYWYCGRSDDMMKSSGQWVSPAEVEGALLEHPAILECAVAAVAGDDGVARPRAFIVLRDAATQPSQEAFREFLRARIAHFKVPHTFEVVTELPKTATGKIQRFKLREQGPR